MQIPAMNELKFLLAIFLLFGCSSSPESTQSDVSPKPDPSNPIYFHLQGDSLIWVLDPVHQVFDSLEQFNRNWIDVAISGNGRYLIGLTSNSLFQFDLLNQRIRNTYALKNTPLGNLSCSQDASLLAFEGVAQGQRTVILFYLQDGLSQVFRKNSSNPLLSPSARWLAFNSAQKLIVSTVTDAREMILSNAQLIPQNFSPQESYLSASGKIFDLQVLQKFPVERNGLVKFIDELWLLWVEPQGQALTKSNLSGTQQSVLFETPAPIIDFAISAEKRFVVTVHQEEASLIFTAFDFLDQEMAFTISFPNPENRIFHRLLWPEKPAGLTHDD